LLTKFKKPVVAWHDPNFGIRFKDNLDAIAAAVPPNSFRFIAESSLKIMQQNGFKALLPGIEYNAFSWMLANLLPNLAGSPKGFPSLCKL
jgi:hypothetical protein